ncbi:hypothetical protein DPMN_174363 [Dreissena polymorpha]|uniref:Uncharacterized protein n=1 Tax=Dreissena polymorpha TaxID=45954 RepID=A0A9D3XZK0_DREPO|nr:hypothetical protein DPMN_194654 [Dreissena polymorpha]KAH3773015.1 hypothetical protein DPMN_174363 [Dreissena polymorpha]
MNTHNELVRHCVSDFRKFVHDPGVYLVLHVPGAVNAAHTYRRSPWRSGYGVSLSRRSPWRSGYGVSLSLIDTKN